MKLFETIRINKGIIYNLHYHEQRLNRSRQALFGCKDYIFLSERILPPDNISLYRCKITYGKTIGAIDFYHYHTKRITSFTLVNSSNAFDYSHKYLNRKYIDQLFRQKGNRDDIIIIKQGLVTDSSKANIAVFYNKNWITPKTPLLPGTTRQRLLEQKIIKESDISMEQLLSTKKIALMNAMIDFMIIENPVFCNSLLTGTPDTGTHTD